MLVHNLAPPCALSVEVADYLSTLLAYVKEFFLLCYLRVHPVTLGLPLLALSEGTVGHGSVAAYLTQINESPAWHLSSSAAVSAP